MAFNFLVMEYKLQQILCIIVYSSISSLLYETVTVALILQYVCMYVTKLSTLVAFLLHSQKNDF